MMHELWFQVGKSDKKMVGSEDFCRFHGNSILTRKFSDDFQSFPDRNNEKRLEVIRKIQMCPKRNTNSIIRRISLENGVFLYDSYRKRCLSRGFHWEKSGIRNHHSEIRMAFNFISELIQILTHAMILFLNWLQISLIHR